MLHQLPGAFALTARQAQLQHPDITDKRGDAFRDRERAAGFIQHIVHGEREGVVVGKAALLGDFLRHFELRIPVHRGEQERRVHAHVVMDAVIGVLQHLRDDALHRAVAFLGEIAADAGEQRLEQIVFTQQAISRIAITGLQQLQRLFKQTRRRHVIEQRGEARDRLAGFRADAHIKPGGEAHRAQHTHRIFAVAGFRIADKTDNPFFKIVQAADVITYCEIGHAVIEAVDGEIATLGVFFDRAENVVAQQHAVLAALGGGAIARVLFVMTAKGGDFNDFRPEHDVGQAETAANQAAVAEQLAYLIRRGVGGDVEIFRLFAKQQIAHTTADKPGFITGFIQAVHHFKRVLADIFAGDSVLFTRDNGYGGLCDAFVNHALLAV